MATLSKDRFAKSQVYTGVNLKTRMTAGPPKDFYQAWVVSPRQFLFKEIEMSKLPKLFFLTIVVIAAGLYLLSPVVMVKPSNAPVAFHITVTPMTPDSSYTWAG